MATKVEKKRSKKSKEVIDPVVEATVDAKVDEDSSAHDEGQDGMKKKKRKRDARPDDELEIDLSLPEPLSKKALRKAKKQKTNTGLAADGAPAAVANGGDAESKSSADVQEDGKLKRSQYGVWIGNLPWTASKQDLRSFITDTVSIPDSSITRIHMPTPNPPGKAPREDPKPAFQNKGFAYVDLDTPEHLDQALQLTELPFTGGGRRVLVKNATSFAGRPEVEQNGGFGLSANKANSKKPPSKRVFVGNLAFETTKEDLTQHYAQCGTVADVHVATFEDSGKCKGFAWVTFEEIEAAEAAVRGFVYLAPKEEDQEDEDDEDEEDGKEKKQPKRRKWWVNRFVGRQLRVEFAEDPSVRYKKRFGKDANRAPETNGEANGKDLGGASKQDGGAKDARRATNNPRQERKPPQKLVGEVNLEKLSGAIVEAKGTKTTFDD